MNLYICSTLRHLLFAISKASNNPREKSTILFFYDYQNIDPKKIETNTLKSNIQILTLTRDSIKKELKKTIIGRVLFFLAMRNTLPNKITSSLMANKLSRIKEIKGLSDINNISLFLFNDRNKMARIFKLLVTKYEVIEDGVGNYFSIPKKGISRYLKPVNIKGNNTWIIGECNRCTAINVTTPENLPLKVQEKGREIDFLGASHSLDFINRIFKFTPKIPKNCKNIVIIATQPLSKHLAKKLNDTNYFIYLHRIIADMLDRRGINFYIKLHPSENIESYLHDFDRNKFLSVKHPLELELINSTSNVNIISINSTAGLGFESFCSRKKLIRDEEMGSFNEIIIHWKNNPNSLINRIEKAL